MSADFRLLGPLEVVLDGERLDIGHRRQRLLLGVLLLEAGRPVRFDRLIRLAWSGDDPPRTARNALQVGVSKLRATLGDAAEIVTTGEAYRVEVAPEHVDAHRFRVLVEQAGRVESEQAIGLYGKALALWRGPVLAGTFDDELRDLLCGGLIEERLLAIEAQIDHKLRLGLHGQVIPELTDLVGENPTRERAAGQLMLALYRCGRQADALAVFRRTRSTLVEELGIEPSQELESLHRRILNGDTGLALPSVAVPAPAPRRFLPRDVPDFTGRARELQHLDEMALNSTGTSHTLIISAIAGAGGVGKTALAVRWAHRVALQFPDGQLYLNLRGYDSRHPLRTDEATRMLLRALGIAGDEIPHDVDEAAGLYRSTVAGKKLLILLDNARSAEQVRPLLPAGPGSLVLVTSRDSLAGLIARDSASRLILDMMLPEEAIDLLAAILGTGRVDAEPEAARELAKVCGYLPLALRVAAANLVGLPATGIADYVAELSGHDRIAALAVDDDPQSSVTAVFDLSYRNLAAPAQQLFRGLGLMPGADFTADAASAMLDLEPDTGAQTLTHLVAANLVNRLPNDRYGMHDLIREYAARLCDRHDAPAERHSAVGRLLDWYVAMIQGATEAIRRYRLPIPIDALPPRFPVRQVTGVAEGLSWLDTEYGNLLAVIRVAVSMGRHAHVVQLVHLLQPYFIKRGLFQDWMWVLEQAVGAASSMGDKPAEAHTLLELGSAHELSGDPDIGWEHVQRALLLFQAARDVFGQARSLEHLAVQNRKRYRFAEAAEQLRTALEMFRELGDEDHQVNVQSALSVNLYLLKRHDEALQQAREALELGERIGADAHVRSIRVNLGRMYAELGRYAESIEHTEAALALHRTAGGGAGEVVALTHLSYSLSRVGQHDRAVAVGLEAVEVAGRMSLPEFETIALNTLAEAHWLAGDGESALRRYREVLELTDRTRSLGQRERAEEGIARVLGNA